MQLLEQFLICIVHLLFHGFIDFSNASIDFSMVSIDFPIVFIDFLSCSSMLACFHQCSHGFHRSDVSWCRFFHGFHRLFPLFSVSFFTCFKDNYNSCA